MIFEFYEDINYILLRGQIKAAVVGKSTGLDSKDLYEMMDMLFGIDLNKVLFELL